MSDIFMKALELTVMIVVVFVMTKVLPYIKQHVDQEKLDGFRAWVEDVVAYAQQMLDNNGDKKDIVTQILRDIRDKEKLPLSNEQIDILIESAVKQLKIMEGSFANAETIINEIEHNKEEETWDNENSI